MQFKNLQLKRAMRAALLVLLLSVVEMTKGYAETIGDLNYSLDRTTLTATVTGHKNGTSATGNLTIPSSVTYTDYEYNSSTHQYDIPVTRTYTVTTIGGYAFRDCSGFTGNLTIGNSVTKIGYSAFMDCSGFTGSLTIPNSVTTIGMNAFRNCSGFTGNLTIGNSVTKIGDSAFMDCSGFTGSLTIPNSVTTIEYYAFQGCTGFTGNLTIGNSVTYIGYGAFRGCSGFTGSLTIPNSVTYIGNGAFENCSGFTEVLYNADNDVEYGFNLSPFRRCGGTLIIGNNVTKISASLFQNSGFTGSLTIGNSVTLIGRYAFSGCSGFTGSLTIPNSVTSIEREAFYGCSGFTGSLTIGNSVTTIGYDAFENCSGFTGSLTIPNSVTTIGNYAFDYCTGFTGSLTIGNSVTSIGGGAFRGCSGFTELHYNATNAVECVFIGSNFLTCIIGENVESLPNYNMFYNTNLSLIKSNAVEPPTVGGYYTFAGVNKDIPVIVPCGSVEAYQEAPYWSEFTYITDSEYVLSVNATPNHLGSAIIVQKPDCYNSHCSVKAIPNTGCRFINWTCNGEEVSQDRNYEFDLEEDMTLVANFETHKRFVRTVSLFWSDPNNWEPAGVPDDTMSVDLKSDVTIDTDVTVGSVFNDGNYVLTIMPGATLMVTDKLESPRVYNIIIEDGGQLIHPNDGVYARVKKTVNTQNENSDNWSLIAYPFAVSGNVSGVGNMFYDQCDYHYYQYDLYYYNEPTQYWNNYKQTDNVFNQLEKGIGYLYANSSPVTLFFTGQLQNGIAPVNIPLNYTEGIDHPGYNLVGNPYVHNVTSYASENVAEGCYRLNETRDEIIVSEISEANPLKVAEGFFVKATSENASITFNPQAKGKASHGGSIRLEITENGQLVDRLIVKEKGELLEKLSLKKGSTKLFATEGQRELAMVPVKGNEQAISFKAAHDGTYTLKVNVDGMVVERLHLIDNLTGEDTNLLDTSTGSVSDYTFEAKTTDDAHRFKLVLSISGDADIDKNK